MIPVIMSSMLIYAEVTAAHRPRARVNRPPDASVERAAASYSLKGGITADVFVQRLYVDGRSYFRAKFGAEVGASVAVVMRETVEAIR